jgi:hypothetical protein
MSCMEAPLYRRGHAVSRRFDTTKNPHEACMRPCKEPEKARVPKESLDKIHSPRPLGDALAGRWVAVEAKLRATLEFADVLSLWRRSKRCPATKYEENGYASDWPGRSCRQDLRRAYAIAFRGCVGLANDFERRSSRDT